MRRVMVLGALLLAGAVSIVGVARQQDQLNIEVDRLEDNLFVLRGAGGGGNTAVFVTTTGVVVVDSKNPGWGQPILDEIKKLTSNPVTTLINTHSHGDHVSGNVAFPATVEIVTHETTRANMEAMRPYTGRTEPPLNVFKNSNGRGLPTRTFTDTPRRRHLSRQARAVSCRCQWWERRRHRRHTAEGARHDSQHRHDHHRSQHPDDVE